MAEIVNSLLLVGAFAVVVALVRGFRAFLRHRREQAAPFRNYFTTEYDRDMLRYSAWSEDENWRAESRPRAAATFSRNSAERW